MSKHLIPSFLSVLLVSLIFAAGITFPQEGGNPLVRHTVYGDIEGLAAETSYGGEAVRTYAWLGVPFAEPPVGELRWKAPREPNKWQGVMKTDKLGPPCTQVGGMMSIFDCGKIGTMIGSEDCLYLNIWRPQTSEKNLPVYFWIYGGANVVGQSGMPLYNGANFAGRQNAVFVSLNYRLGPLGWFTNPGLKTGDPMDDSGNYGTLDIIKALEWVRDNIENFGGNPGNVTIAGESAGGQNVFSMIVSPLAKGLFHRGVSESGGAFAVSMDSGRSISHAVIVKLMIRDGLETSEEGAEKLLKSKDNAWVSDYLRKKTPEEIYSCFGKSYMGTLDKQFEPLIDGKVIPASPLKLLKSGEYNRVPLIAGSNREEAKLFLPFVMGDVTEKDICLLLKDLDPENPNVDLNDYMSFSDKILYTPIGRFSGMAFKFVGVDLPVELMSSHQKDVYAYRFDWNDQPAPLNRLIGASHAMEMPFLFGNFTTDKENLMRFAWNSENMPSVLRLSKRMMNYWGNFMRHGDPNSAGLPEWKPWPERMIFDSR